MNNELIVIIYQKCFAVVVWGQASNSVAGRGAGSPGEPDVCAGGGGASPLLVHPGGPVGPPGPAL